MMYLWHTNEGNYPDGQKIGTFRNYTDVFRFLEADKKTWQAICRDWIDEQWELITPDGPILLNSRDGRQEYYRRRIVEDATGR